MKKIFISSDIEGTCGITNWDETTRGHVEYALFQERMTQEVNAACVGANKGGATSILVKDAHDSARNIDGAKLPRNTSLYSGWGRDLQVMMSGLDASFDGVFLTGYHSGASMGGNPLAHTMNTNLSHVTINGLVASEMLINLYTAAMHGVPVLLVTGDENLCTQVKEFSPSTLTVGVSRGVGAGSIAMNPLQAQDAIEAAAEKAMALDGAKVRIKLPDNFLVEVTYRTHDRAKFNSFYPGVVQKNEHTIYYSAKEYVDVLTFFHFCL